MEHARVYKSKDLRFTFFYDILHNTMIEFFCKKIIEELGPTGLLVIGLYFILYRPLLKMSESLATINHELATVITLLEKMTWQK